MVNALWCDVMDDIHRHDAEMPHHTDITEPREPYVSTSGAATHVDLPVRAGVDVGQLEAQLMQLHHEESSKPRLRQGPFRLNSSQISVRTPQSHTHAQCHLIARSFHPSI